MLKSGFEAYGNDPNLGNLYNRDIWLANDCSCDVVDDSRLTLRHPPCRKFDSSGMGRS